MKIAIGSDHAGFDLKSYLVDALKDLDVDVDDKGTNSGESVDYPDYGFQVAESVGKGESDKGVLVCGSGVGMSIIANKVNNVRAALCSTPEQAALSRQHNDANVLVLAGRMLDRDTARNILKEWLNAEFEGGRHERRIKKIHDLSGR